MPAIATGSSPAAVISMPRNSRPGYGFAGGQRDPHQLRLSGGVLDEIPPATIKLAGSLLPAAGGAYFRLLPYRLVESALLSAERRGVPATFYIHPGELDADQPRLQVPALTRVRHYGGLSRTISRLDRLLTDFRFQSIAATLGMLRVSSKVPGVATAPSTVVAR